jgi:hypothetical protein
MTLPAHATELIDRRLADALRARARRVRARRLRRPRNEASSRHHEHELRQTG